MTASAPIVLLHGVGLDKSMWDAAAARLPGEVIALDLPGHGKRAALRSEQTLADLADDVLARMPEEPVHLVGFSLGSLIAQHIARFHPERVRTLTCVSSVCLRTPAERAAVEDRLTGAAGDFAESVEASIQRWYPSGTTVPQREIERTRDILLSNDVESYLHAYAVFARGDAEIGPELGAIACPTLAVTGEHDPGSTPDMSRRLAAAVRDGRAVSIPDARHMLPVERTAALCASITSFITEPEGTTP